MQIGSKGWWMVVGMVLGAGMLFAQSPAYHHYSLDNGLASSMVYATIQDRAGFMWFATESGVSRFDGSSFQNFTVSDGLTANDVLNLYEDSSGRIWFFPFKSHLCYYEGGKIHNPQTDPWLDSLRGRNFFPSFYEDRKGNMWFGDDQGTILCLTPDGKIIKNGVDAETGFTSYWRIYENGQGDVMAATHAIILNLTEEKVVRRIDPPLPRYFQRAISIGKDSLLCAAGTTLHLIHADQEYPLTLPPDLAKAEILILKLDAKRNLWMGTRDGAYCLADFKLMGANVEFSSYRKILPSITINSILEDLEGNFWMASITNGVFFFPSVEAATYTVGAQGEGSFTNKVLVDRTQTVWVGFDRGRYGKLVNGQFEWHEFPMPILGRGRTVEIFEDRKGNVFLSNDDATAIFRPDGWFDFSKSAIKAMVQAPNGDYYISNAWELHHLQNDVDVTRFFDVIAELRAPRIAPISSRALSLIVTPEGKFLLGTLNGLREKTPDGIVPVKRGPTSAVSEILQTPEGVLWMSTLSAGVTYQLGDSFYTITAADGLASNICHGFTFDENGVVYVATNRGISRIEMYSYPERKFHIRNFGINSGLASDEVRHVAVANGKIYAATAKGFSVLNEADLTAVPPPVRVLIMEINAGGQTIAFPKKPIVLGADQDQLAVSYTGISFRNADKLQFEYRLSRDGAEGEWVATRSRELEFPALQAGKYQLTVRAMVKGLPATTGMAAMDFEILPTLWETIWFRAVAIVVSLLLVSGVFGLLLRRLRVREERRTSINKRIAELEHTALRSQMNPHFIFNSLNSIEKFYIQNRQEEANSYIADFSELIRAILELSSKPFISLAEELRLVELLLSLESHRVDHRFDYETIMDPQIHPETVMIPPLILQPFIENAIWHGISLLEQRKGRIQISISATPTGTIISIEDNGIGRQKSEALKSKYRKKHRSSGIRITKERFDLLNLDAPPGAQYTIEIRDLEDTHHAPSGTAVILFLPQALTQLPA